jgi:hypothetical protein
MTCFKQIIAVGHRSRHRANAGRKAIGPPGLQILRLKYQLHFARLGLTVAVTGPWECFP